MDYSKSINEQELLHETKIILSLIYRDYICAAEERKKLLLKDKKEIEEKEKILQEKYNIDFEKRKECIESKEQSKNMYLVEIKKERWYQRIIKKIFEFFKMNK